MQLVVCLHATYEEAQSIPSYGIIERRECSHAVAAFVDDLIASTTAEVLPCVFLCHI